MTTGPGTPEAEANLIVVGIGMGHYRDAELYKPLTKSVQILTEEISPIGAQSSLLIDKPRGEIHVDLETVLPENGFRGDNLLLLWTGHGVAPRPDQLRLVLCDTTRPTANSTYSPAQLAELAAESGARQILIVLDTCYSGAALLPVAEAIQDIKEAAMDQSLWLGVLAATQNYNRAVDGALLRTLADLLRDGPRTDAQRATWALNDQVTGDELLHTVLAEWQEPDCHQLPEKASLGLSRAFFPNPCRVAPLRRDPLVAHLMLAARGGDPDEVEWYFTGRSAPLDRVRTHLESRDPGILVVTGPAGSGKSAVLGRIASLSDQDERATMEKHGALDDVGYDPGVGTVAAALNLRNATPEWLVSELGRRVGQPRSSTIYALMDWCAQQPRPPVFILDGLDEAGPEARQVARHAVDLGRVACILVASRTFEAGMSLTESNTSLPQLLAAGSSDVVDLGDEDQSVVARDITEYARRRLSPTLAGDLLDKAAQAVATLATDDAQGGVFLLARVLTSQIRDNPSVDISTLASSLEEAFESDIAQWPPIQRNGVDIPHAARDLLFALAFAAGSGFPARDVWPAVATALGKDSYAQDDVSVLIGRFGQYYGRYIVASREHGQAVYRLYHRRLVDHLRGSLPVGAPRLAAIYTALHQLAARQLERD